MALSLRGERTVRAKVESRGKRGCIKVVEEVHVVSFPTCVPALAPCGIPTKIRGGAKGLKAGCICRQATYVR